MTAKLSNNNVVSVCLDCGVTTTFEFKSDNTSEHGSIVQEKNWKVDEVHYRRAIYRLMRCAGCGRGGMAKICDNGRPEEGVLDFFHPISIETFKLPSGIPEGIVKEFREAELDAASGAWRSASAMLRSTLEKTLKANGYTDDILKAAKKRINLEGKIDLANEDGLITDSRKKRAHDEIRVLGNDVLHDDWKEVSSDDYDLAHLYTQRILEDFYDDRPSVEAVLKSKERILQPKDAKEDDSEKTEELAK